LPASTSKTLTPEQRSLRARCGAFAQHAQHDPKETTVAARVAFEQKFLDQVDPERQLPEAERLRRAEAAKSAHFARLAYLSSRARQGRAS
jgi:hypothetical protein